MEINSGLSRNAKIGYACGSIVAATAICVVSGGGGFLFGRSSANAQEPVKDGFPISDASCALETPTQTATPNVLNPTADLTASPTATPTETAIMFCYEVSRTPTPYDIVIPSATNTRDSIVLSKTPTFVIVPTNTPRPTNTNVPPITSTPTDFRLPTNTHSIPTLPRSTETPRPTNTSRPPTSEPTQRSTATEPPRPTNTPRPPNTDFPTPIDTNTHSPEQIPTLSQSTQTAIPAQP